MKCRHCGAPLEHLFLDLGTAPPSNAYLTAEALNQPEVYYPLKVWVCDQCWLVQTEDYARADQFFDADYAYFSSTSSSWLAHAAAYVDMITARLGLNGTSHVIEVAANDGYLLKNFVAAGIPCLGIEPTDSTADAAEQMGIPVLRAFLGETMAAELHKADLIIGNNVFAHVPDVNDFARGLARALKPDGVVTLEFPHLLKLVEQVQFDTIYHEHFSYLSLYSVQRILRAAGLRVFDVDTLPTHGGSLRVYACHAGSSRKETEAVSNVLAQEQTSGLRSLATYQAFQARANKIKDDLLSFLLEQKRAGKVVVAYGAAAKGNTLLNYAGVRPDLLPCVFDAAPSKQGKFLPGSRIPILAPSALAGMRPDYVLVLPWNLIDEVRAQQHELRATWTRFVTAIPKMEVV